MTSGHSDTIFYLFHGFLGTSADWNDVRSKLRGHSVAPDLLSANSERIEEWPVYLEKFFSRQEEEPIGRKILVGYSLGGRLSLEILREKFWQWDHIVLISTNPGFLSDEEKRERTINDEKWAQRFQVDTWGDVMRDWNGQAVFSTTEENFPKENEFSREQLSRALQFWSLGKTKTHDRTVLLAPHVHWLVGERDQKFLNELSKQEGLNLTVVPKAGHRILKDNPEFVVNFLRLLS